MTVWKYDDPSIVDEDVLYRRVPRIPDCRTFDPCRDCWVPGPGALRRDAGEGMSTHLASVLGRRGRDAMTLYPSTHGSIGFEVSAPRSALAGVLQVPDPNETDADLRAAHSEVRPPHPRKDRLFWNNVVNVIVASAWWVQSPD